MVTKWHELDSDNRHSEVPKTPKKTLSGPQCTLLANILVCCRTIGAYYGLVVVTLPRPQTLHLSHDNLKNPY